MGNPYDQYSFAQFLEAEENFSHSKSSSASITNESSSSLVPWPLPPLHTSTSTTAFPFSGFPSMSIPIEGFSEDKAIAASKSHSQAEKRRRDRINAQLATLRKLIPKSDKMDKAALLGSVIDQVKDLKRKAMEVSKSIMVPTEVDEITIEKDLNINKTNDNIYIRASLCCDDRPELFSELIQVLKVQKLTAVRADVASIGGRIKSVLVVCSTNAEAGVCMNTLRQSLRLVLSKIASSSLASNLRVRSKRQRFFLPSSHNLQ
ncbi:hypothetical protein UlMin_045461 [Ulmus minor]